MTGQSSELNLLKIHSDAFNFDMLYLSYPFRYRVIQHLIGKLSGMVNMKQVAKDVVGLLMSVRTS